MGVIIGETITLTNGLTVTNPYAAVAENELRIVKRVGENMSDETDLETGETTTTTTSITKYIIKCRFNMWASRELRASGSKDIGYVLVELEPDTPPTGNIYDLLYNKLKTMKTCTDSI